MTQGKSFSNLYSLRKKNLAQSSISSCAWLCPSLCCSVPFTSSSGLDPPMQSTSGLLALSAPCSVIGLRRESHANGVVRLSLRWQQEQNEKNTTTNFTARVGRRHFLPRRFC